MTTATPTRESLTALIRQVVDKMKVPELKRLDSLGGRIYLLTDADDGMPYLYVSLGSLIDRIYHEWAEQQGSPAAHVKLDAWQESKTPPDEHRKYLHDKLPDALIDGYLQAVDELDDSSS